MNMLCWTALTIIGVVTVETFVLSRYEDSIMLGPSKDVKEHLDESEPDAAIDEAQSNEETRVVRRLCLIKNLYAGDSITEAATRVGVTQPTASRWTDRWNRQGVDGLHPDFGGGRPPKLSEREQQRLTEVLEQHQSLTTEQVRKLIEQGFGVSYSQRHVSRLLKKLGIRHAVPRPESLDRPDDAEEQPQKRLEAALNEFDDGVVADGGVIVGHGEALPRTIHNSQRL
jgi:putative transposase